MTVVMERTATGTPTEIDARDAVRAIVAAEGVPAPVFVQSSLRRGAVSVMLPDRDAVDEWAAMLGARVARGEDSYGLHWSDKPTHPLLPGLFIDFYCDVPPIKWQPRTRVVAE